MSKKETNFTLIFYILVDFLRKTILLSKKISIFAAQINITTR